LVFDGSSNTIFFDAKTPENINPYEKTVLEKLGTTLVAENTPSDDG